MSRRFAKSIVCNRSCTRRSTAVAGFSLIELMVAMLLGLIVIGGVCSVFIANQQVYSTNSALSDVQENTRTSFELLAQNIREAGLLGCGNNGQVANVLVEGPYNGGTAWWANWDNALKGYGSGTSANPALAAVTNQVPGTDSLMILSAANVGLTVHTHTPSASTFSLNGTTPDLTNMIMIVCDPWQATIFRVSTYNAGANPTVTYALGSNANCSSGLAYPTACTTGGNAYQYAANSPIATLAAGVWYIGNNPFGTTSLYLASLNPASSSVTSQEMVRGVTKMYIYYHVINGTSFAAASASTVWSAVDAVQVQLFVQQSSGPDAGTTGTPTATAIQRSYIITSTVRNRVQ